MCNVYCVYQLYVALCDDDDRCISRSFSPHKSYLYSVVTYTQHKQRESKKKMHAKMWAMKKVVAKINKCSTTCYTYVVKQRGVL